MRKNYLEIKDVDFKIGGKTKVKSASFSIENEGETLCILGPFRHWKNNNPQNNSWFRKD
jgi:ABC-type Fe3+/spermidine/putrescine transport system ATPase subunit